ncbi:hypothetical protein [Peribacillus muralis]|uniref:hypothetical protein n=1 Tax=Peribacillus muralis TaxID=264697 RepID=UPI003D045A65
MLGILQVTSKSIKPVLVLWASMYLFVLILVGMNIGGNANIIYLITQFIFIPLSGILFLHLFNDLFGSEHSTFLHTFYKGKVEKMYGAYLMLYMLPLIVLCTLIDLRYEGFEAIPASILLLSQALLFTCITLILFVITTDLSISITISVLYLSIELATFGNVWNLIHIFYMNLQEPIVLSAVYHTLIVNFVLGLIGYRFFKMLVS